MENLIIVKRTAILITNYKQDAKDNTVIGIVKKLSVYGKPVFNGGPKSIDGRYYVVQERPNAKGTEIVDTLIIPRNTPMSIIQNSYPFHRVVQVDKVGEYIAYGTGVTLNPEFDYRNENQEWIVSYLNRTGHFVNMKETGIDLVSAATSAGKTYSFIRSWVERGAPKLLISFAKQDHLNNFKFELQKFTSLKDEDFLIVHGLDSISKATDAKVTLVLARTVYNSFSSRMELTNSNPNSVKSLQKLDGEPSIISFIKKSKIGEICIDEVHMEMFANMLLGMFANVKKVTLLSATVGRTKDQENKIFSMFLPSEYLELKKEKRLVVEPIGYKSWLNQNFHNLCYTKYGFLGTSYHTQLARDSEAFERFIDTLAACISSSKENGAHTIGVVLAASLDFINKTEERLKTIFPNLQIGSYNGKTPKDKKDNILNGDVCISTEKSFNGSINPLMMDYMIFHSPIKSPILVEQITGRLRGADGMDCIVIDLIDTSVSGVYDAWLDRSKVFKKIAKEVDEIVHM